MTDLDEELALLREERQRLSDSIRDDDEPTGDVADQAEALSLFDRIDQIDRRIDQMVDLQQERRRQPLDPSTERVSVGTEVSLRFSDGSTENVQVVQSILEEDDGDPVVTPESPLGRAILGAQVGDKVSYQAPAGSVETEVVAIRVP